MSDVNNPLKHHPCPLCGSEEVSIIVKGGDLLEGLPGTFQFVECKTCKLLRQDPRLDWTELSKYYKPGYVCHAVESSDHKEDLERNRLPHGAIKKVDLIQKYKKRGAWLDVGCGNGTVLRAAKSRGLWELAGLEPIEQAAKYTSQALNIPVFIQTLEKFEVSEEAFDIITMWDVLEHLSEPVVAIDKVAQLLKPGGIFVFTTPNLSSLGRKIFKKYWVGYDLPRHLHLFPRQALQRILNEHGLTIMKRFSLSGSYGLLYLSLLFWNNSRSSGLLKRILSKGPSSFLFRILTFLPLRLLDWLKLGTNIGYIVIKNE